MSVAVRTDREGDHANLVLTGDPCQTPNIEKLAANGLKYSRFHTTALRSPTRALLTGRNHHSAGARSTMPSSKSKSSGYDGVRLWREDSRGGQKNKTLS